MNDFLQGFARQKIALMYQVTKKQRMYFGTKGTAVIGAKVQIRPQTLKQKKRHHTKMKTLVSSCQGPEHIRRPRPHMTFCDSPTQLLPSNSDTDDLQALTSKERRESHWQNVQSNRLHCTHDQAQTQWLRIIENLQQKKAPVDLAASCNPACRRLRKDHLHANCAN